MRCNDGNGEVFRSMFPMGEMPPDPTGRWACTTMTVGGQLVGVRKFQIVTPDGKSTQDAARRNAGVTAPAAGDADEPTCLQGDATAPDAAPIAVWDRSSG